MEVDPLARILELISTDYGVQLFALFYTCLEIFGLILALDAIRNSRTAQASIAWSLSLIFIPFISPIFYLSFGRSKFRGNAKLRRKLGQRIYPKLELHHDEVTKFFIAQNQLSDAALAFSSLAKLPWVNGNKARLLINGQETFEAIFKAINEAKDYILIQFFIVETDILGHKFKDHLKAAAARGVRVYFIPDAIGCYHVPEGFWDELRASGVEVHPFEILERRSKRFQINFRNHRKIVIVDGKKAYFGGHNVGDNYLGVNTKLSPWRDTHVEVEGPMIASLQMSFLEDWYFVKGDEEFFDHLPKFEWKQEFYENGVQALVMSSGPADELETCGLMFAHAISAAVDRFWVASPYFIPDGKIISALILACLRGVDVRILLPRRPDHMMVYFAREDYFETLQKVGVKFYLYESGFLHQKVFLVDKVFAGVGTANLDNRSFRLNFEVTGIFSGGEFVQQVEDMLNEDFSQSRLLERFRFKNLPLWRQLVVKICRLFSPVL